HQEGPQGQRTGRSRERSQTTACAHPRARTHARQEDDGGGDPAGGRRDRSRKKMDLGRRLIGQGRWAVKRVAAALEISRPHLSVSSRTAPKPRERYDKLCDAETLARIAPIIEDRPTYGYRRVTALLNRETPTARVNHKRIYRIMKNAGLMLPKYT